MIALEQATQALRHQGWRRLLVISGDARWCDEQVAACISALDGDWLWVGERPGTALHCAPAALKNLLGREFLHAVFDAREGFHAEALAALAGTLQAGSWLLLLLPEWSRWQTQPDADSLRWSDSAAAVASPRFVSHWQKLLLADRRVALCVQGQTAVAPALPVTAAWHADNQQQQHLLSQLLHAGPGVHVLTAARGRGKSALAGMLAARWPGRCLVTAPARVSTAVLEQFAADAFEFVAPDRLLAEAERWVSGTDWLLIDEAAAIPAPLLRQLVALVPRVLLTTTVQGYEGTGRGFMLKFCASLDDCRYYQLDAPLRWAENDPLEQLVTAALLLEDGVEDAPGLPLAFRRLEQQDWHHQPATLTAIYRLLTSAHYRTSPLDLRRMMDAPGMHFAAAMQGETVQAALWLADEGGLSAELAAAVWAGTRRPRGNLVAQSLAAHAGLVAAPQLRSRRITRIAVSPALRGRGIGQALIARCHQQAQGLDFLSVSFGFTAELWRFWQRCGFRLARVGSQREASSGCYTAMAILPLSAAGEQLAREAEQRLTREGYWLRQQLDEDWLPLAQHCDTGLSDEDWRELTGFAWAHRPFEASLAALGRLTLLPLPLPLPLLNARLTARLPLAQICHDFGLHGRKALLAAWRVEAQQALMALDDACATAACNRVRSLQ